MSPRRTVALARRLFLQVLRDRREMALIFLVPVLIMQLVSWVVRDSLNETIRVAIDVRPQQGGPEFVFKADSLRSNVEDAIVAVNSKEGQSKDSAARFELVSMPVGGEVPDLRGESLNAVFEFPPEFLQDRAQGRPGRIVIHTEGSDPGQVLLIRQGLEQSLADVLAHMDIELPLDCPAHCGEALNLQPPAVAVVHQAGASASSLQVIDYYLPAIVPYMAFFFGFMMTALSFLRERTGGTLERLMASPLTRMDLVLGYFGGFLSFSMIQAAVIVGYALYVLDVPTASGVVPVVLLLVLTILTAEGFGIFFSTFANSEFQVMQMLPMFVFPQLFVCGIIWKVKNLPYFLIPLAKVLPMTYSAQAARELMVRGDLAAGYAQMGYLTLFLLLSMLLSVLSMRRRIL